MHAPPHKCCKHAPVGIIGKDQTNLNRSHHSSSSVKAVSPGGGGGGVNWKLLAQTVLDDFFYQFSRPV